MSGGRRRIRLGGRTKKQVAKPKTYTTIQSVLKSRHSGENLIQRLYYFFNTYRWEDFGDVFQILLKQEEVREALKLKCHSFSSFLDYPDTDNSDFSLVRQLQIFKNKFTYYSDDLLEFENTLVNFDNFLMQGDTLKIKKLLSINLEGNGYSFWYLSNYLNVLAINNEYEKVNEAIDAFTKENNTPVVEWLISNLYQVIKGTDIAKVLEESTIIMNNEFIEGGATTIASLSSLLYLPYSIYDSFDTSHALSMLQEFPVIDSYFYLTILVNNICSGDSLYEKQFEGVFPREMLKLITEIEAVIPSKRIRSIKAKLEKYIASNPELIDKDVKSKAYLLYTEGRYCDVVKLIDGKTELNITDMSNINMYVKSSLYTKTTPHIESSFYADIFNNLCNLYNLKSVEQSINELVSVVIRFNNTEVSKHILLAIRNAIPYFISESQHSRLISTLNSDSTPISFVSSNPLVFIDQSIFPQAENLILKADIKKAITTHSSEVNLLKKLNEFKEKTLVHKDYIELKIEYFKVTNKWSALIEFAADELIDFPDIIHLLPIETMSSYIDDNGFYTQSSVIFSYYYNFQKDKKIDHLLNECFEEFLVANEIKHPSSFFSGKASITKKESFIFDKVASLNVIAYIGCCRNDSELSSERLLIIEKLKKFGAISSSKYNEEYSQIINAYIVQSGVTEMSYAKIFVNKTLFISANLDTTFKYMEQFQNEAEETSRELYQDLKAEDKLIFAKGARNEVTIKLFEDLTRSFLQNDDFGLDKNLSSEIRHSFFSNQISSSLDNVNLLAELNSSGEYTINSFWVNKYSYVNQSIMSRIECEISSATESINALIEKAENWMNVGIGPQKEEVIFIFNKLSIEQFESLKEILVTSQSATTVVVTIYDVLVSQLEEKLIEMKRLLNEVFLVEIEELLKKLTNCVSEIKQNIHLKELSDAIKKATESIKDDVKIICEWFALKSKNSANSYPINHVIEIAIKCFNDCFSNQIQFDVDVIDDSLIEGNHVNALVFALINCFHNASKYGDSSNKIRVDFSGTSSEFSLSIENSITKQHEKYLKNGHLDRITEKVKELNDSTLLRVEGKSGLYKSAHRLKSASQKYQLLPYQKNKRFIVEVSLNDKNINN